MPPQSIPVSSPFWMPSVQVASGVGSSSLQLCQVATVPIIAKSSRKNFKFFIVKNFQFFLISKIIVRNNAGQQKTLPIYKIRKQLLALLVLIRFPGLTFTFRQWINCLYFVIFTQYRALCFLFYHSAYFPILTSLS